MTLNKQDPLFFWKEENKERISLFVVVVFCCCSKKKKMCVPLQVLQKSYRDIWKEMLGARKEIGGLITFECKGDL
jgi:hypothetical protein